MSQSLLDRLCHHIQQQSDVRIPFAAYMDWVLYDEQAGYYTTRSPIGAQGDFLTSPSLAPDFGELLAVQFVEIWQHLGTPHPFTLLEMGAGQGLLAADILTYLKTHEADCFAAIDYQIVEKSAGLRRSQQAHLQALGLEQKVRWQTWAEIPDNSLVGCCFSNELVDAFPIHLVEIHAGQLQEVYVTLRSSPDCSPQAHPAPSQIPLPETLQETLQETLAAPSTPALVQYFQDLGLDLSQYPDGYRTEVNLAVHHWLTTVAAKLQQGYLLTIDYGYSADRYYHPQRHQGTLQCYYQHRHHDNPYVAPGQQDLTAHVNFTALEQWGAALGLERLGFTEQALFLMALGLGDRLVALSNPATAPDFATLLQRRNQLHQLLDPTGLGKFGVLLQAKGIRTVLRGFQKPGLPHQN